MPGEDNIDVTLACVDPALVSSWDKLVKQGKECSLLLKHSKGKVIATLQCTTQSTPSALFSSTSLSPSAKRKKRKKKKGSKKRKLEKLPDPDPDFWPKIQFFQWDPVFFFKSPSEGMDMGSA